MYKIISAASVAALFSIGAQVGVMVCSIAPAAANSAEDNVISTFCNGHPQANECNDWRYNRTKWSDQQYQSFYQSHEADKEFQTPQAAAAFSMPAYVDPTLPGQRVGNPPAKAPVNGDAANADWAVGSHRGNVVGNQPEVIGDSPTHVQDCMATFKSYDPSTDTYMSLAGNREKCKL